MPWGDALMADIVLFLFLVAGYLFHRWITKDENL